MHCFNKKGLSAIIATVLLIALSLTLAAFIFMWMVSFVSEQIEVGGKPVEEVCKSVSFVVDGEYDKSTGGLAALGDDGGNKDTGAQAGDDNGAKNLSLQVVNRGNVDIKGMEVRFNSGGKSSFSTVYLFDAPIADASSVQVFEIEEGVTELILYPVVIGSVVGKKVTKPISCIYSGKTIRLESFK